jgi:hypothetical protein
VIALATEKELPVISRRISDAPRVAVISPPAQPITPAVSQGEPAVQRENKHAKEQFEAIRVPRDAAREALIADLRARQRSALMAPATAAEPLSQDGVAGGTERGRRPAPRVKPAPSITEPTFVSEVTREPVKSRRLFYWLISLAVLGAIAFGAWLVIKQQLPPRQAANTNGANATDAATPSPAAPLISEVPTNALLYSVAIEAHLQLPVAFERVRTLRDEEPAMSFYIAPVVTSNNVMFYHVMAGPVADSASAGALLLRLLEKGHKTAAQPGEVRRAQLAFLLGEYESSGDADAREKEVAELGIPAYVIEVQKPDDTTRFRVYTGAFSSAAEAAAMKQLLVNVGLPDSLVPRVGKQR